MTGVRIAREETGAGPPLLLIQGLGYPRWGWESIVAPLAESYRVITFDNRGIGDSDAPPGPYDTAIMAADAVASLGHDTLARLGDMTAPTLVLHGTVDRVVDPRNAPLLAERIPGAKLELLPGLGHLFFWEDPARTTELVTGFLS